MTDDPRHDIARLVDEAQPIGAEPVGGEGEEFDPSDSWGGGDPPEPPFGDGVDDPSPEKPDTEAVEWCARARPFGYRQRSPAHPPFRARHGRDGTGRGIRR